MILAAVKGKPQCDVCGFGNRAVDFNDIQISTQIQQILDDRKVFVLFLTEIDYI